MPVGNAQQECTEHMQKREIGGAASLLPVALAHMKSVAQEGLANKNAMVFDGTWRGTPGMFAVAFDDGIFNEGGMVGQRLITLCTTLVAAGSGNVILVQEATEPRAMLSKSSGGGMFKVNAIRAGEALKEGWFEAVKLSGGEVVVGMRGDASAGRWWKRADRKDDGLAALIQMSMSEEGDEELDEEDVEEGTSVAEEKMARYGMVFKALELQVG